MDFYTLTFQILNALVFSMLLFLLAAGLSLIFGLLDVINLAHGTLCLLGGYVALTVVEITGNFWLGLLFAPLVVAALSWVLERAVLRGLYERGHLSQVLFTLGLGLVGADLMRWRWGGFPKTIRAPELLSGSVEVANLFFPRYRLAVIVLGLVVALGLWLLLTRTKLGALVRAGSSDSQMVAGLGVNVGRVFAFVFALGAALAALGGVVAAPILGLYPGLDTELLLYALVVVVVGGLGSLGGAFWGSVLVGVADTFAKAFMPEISTFAVFGLMALVLLLRPAGLFGRKV